MKSSVANACSLDLVTLWHIVTWWGYVECRSELAAREESARKMAAALIAEEEHEAKQKGLNKVCSPIIGELACTF